MKKVKISEQSADLRNEAYRYYDQSFVYLKD
jgi:hypothetical protein